MAQINFGGVDETVVTRDEFPLDKALEYLKDDTIAVIGYGVQGPGQALNMRDNGFNHKLREFERREPGEDVAENEFLNSRDAVFTM